MFLDESRNKLLQFTFFFRLLILERKFSFIYNVSTSKRLFVFKAIFLLVSRSFGACKFIRVLDYKTRRNSVKVIKEKSLKLFEIFYKLASNDVGISQEFDKFATPTVIRKKEKRKILLKNNEIHESMKEMLTSQCSVW